MAKSKIVSVESGLVIDLNKKLFLFKLDIVTEVIPKSSVIYDCQNICVELEANKMYLKGTDLERSVRVSMDINYIPTEGDVKTFLINTDLTYNTVKNMEDELFQLCIFESHIEIKTPKGKYKMPLEDAKDYPVFKNIDEASVVTTMSAKRLVDLFGKVSYATSNDAVRLALMGVFFEGRDGKELRFTATDAHKLSTLSVECAGDPFKHIIPKTVVSSLKNIFDDEEAVEILYDTKNAIFRSETTLYYGITIDANYPDYESVLPKGDPSIKVVVYKKDLLNSLKRMFIFSDKTQRQVVFEIGEKEIILTSKDMDFQNEAREVLGLISSTVSDENFFIGFNAKFLAETINTFDEDEVELSFYTPARPVIINSNIEGVNRRALAMPLMISQPQN